MEIWRKINGFEKYEVSNIGNVRSLNYNNTGKPQNLKQKINRYGYNEVKLSKNNKTKNFLVSTLVAQAFFNNKNPDKEVMHIADINDNSINNLKYGYRSEILHQTYKRKRRIGKPSGNFISYNGKQYRKYSDLARDHNITPHRLFRRLQDGWSLEEAVDIPIKRKEYILHKKLYKYNGKLMSIKQLAQINNLTENIVRKRLDRGWSVEESVEIPNLRNQRRISKNEI